MAAKRIRVNVTMTFELPEADYQKFRGEVAKHSLQIEKQLGGDCVLQYAALDQTTRDTILAD